MGFKEILTKPWKLPSTELAWKEPLFYRIRLRRDWHWRLLLALAIAILVGGIMLAILSFYDPPRDWNYALAFALISLPFTLLHLFARHRHASGKVTIKCDQIKRMTIAPGLPNFIVSSDESWKFPRISKCLLITSEDLGCRFSIMLLSYGCSQDIIAIPKRIDPKKVARILLKHGVSVKRGKKLPEDATRSLSFRAPAATLAAGILALIVGLIMYLTAKPPEQTPDSPYDKLQTAIDKRPAPSHAFGKPPPGEHKMQNKPNSKVPTT